MERRCRYVGQEFSLIPVSVASGIFHPKVAYLWGQEYDLLLVGSGNLTFGGYGRNLEVLEVLNSSTNAKAFGDFSDFLDALSGASNIQIAEPASLMQFQKRASEMSRKDVEPGAVRLLNSIDSPIADQLILSARAQLEWLELFVLSPFHNPEGEPIKRIASALGVQHLNVGVSAKSGETSSFPFEEAKTWGIPITVSKPKAEPSDRRLHAKWLELRGRETWALTGSVNATEQSMGSTRNVEVGVLRVLESATAASWEPAQQPPYEPAQFDAADEKCSLPIYADVDDKGILQGQVLGFPTAASGQWKLVLENSERIEYSGEVMLDTQGAFQSALQSFQLFGSGSAYQIRLTNDSLEARGWISVSGILKQSSRTRMALSALSRMMASNETATDASVLLDFISMKAGHAVNVLSQSGGGDGKAAPHAPEGLTFSVMQLETWKSGGQDAVFGSLVSSARSETGHLKVLAAIGRLLLGRKRSIGSGEGVHHGYGKVIGEIGVETEGKAGNESLTALEVFNSSIRSILNRLAEGKLNDQSGLATMLLVWGHANLWMHLVRFEDVSAALVFSDEWIRVVVKASLPVEAKKLLDETVFGIAATLAYRAKMRTDSANSFLGITVTPAVVHGWLGSYCSGKPEADSACEMASSWLSFGVPGRLVAGNGEAAVDALREALVTPTTRTVLEQIHQAFAKGSAVNFPDGLFSLEEMKWIGQIQRAPRAGRAPYKVVNHKDRARCFCPQFHSQDGDTLTRLGTRHIAKCVQCGALLVSLEP